MTAGVDMKTPQARLGHSAVRVTLELYAQALPDAERRAADLGGDQLMRRLRADFRRVDVE